MDDRRFDALTRALAQGSSRRAALKGIVGGLIGGAVVATRLDRAGAQFPCEEDSDCSTLPPVDTCETPACVNGECGYRPDCTSGQSCCGYNSPGAYCAECCDDDGCPGCQICNNQGVCEETECCADSDCSSVCGTCDRGTCVPRCTTGEYCCAFANDCRVQGECCTDDDCPCGGNCSDGTCYPQPSCPDGLLCCDTAHETACTECCGDEDCASCEICVLGVCEAGPGQCCTDDECPCGSCYRGVCLNDCDTGEECCRDECVTEGQCCGDGGDSCQVVDGPNTQGTCCEDYLCCGTGESGKCYECCSDSDCACGFCVGGVCTEHCKESEECCENECVAIGDCCQAEIGGFCTLGEPDPGEDPVVCCGDLLCCETETSAACAECCSDNDCGPCAYCSEGICYGECSQSEQCCNGQCVEGDECCRPEGAVCGVEAAKGSAQLDCCDGYVCCDNLYYGSSVCAECCVDVDCRHGEYCHQGECRHPHHCKDDSQCPKGTCCCHDGGCSGTCCHHPHPHPTPEPSPDGPVTSLPVTGSGQSSESGGLLGATLAGAAALLAARTLRDQQHETEVSEPPPAE